MVFRTFAGGGRHWSSKANAKKFTASAARIGDHLVCKFVIRANQKDVCLLIARMKLTEIMCLGKVESVPF